MGVERTYQEIIKDKVGKTIIVAVVDSGIDIEHEDLKNVMWLIQKKFQETELTTTKTDM